MQTFDVKPLKGMVAEGFRQTEINRRAPQWYKSDSVAFDGSTSNILLRIPPNTLIINAFIDVETAFDASGTSAAATGTLIVNDTGATTIYDAANAGLQAVGMKPSTNPGPVLVGAAGGNVELQIDPATSTVGSVKVYVQLVQLDELL